MLQELIDGFLPRPRRRRALTGNADLTVILARRILALSRRPQPVAKRPSAARLAKTTAALASTSSAPWLSWFSASTDAAAFRCRAKAPLSVLVAPLRCEAPFLRTDRPVAVLFVTDPDKKAKPLVAQIKKQFGLTGAEAAFSVEILKGDGIQAAADRLAISRSTARTHLSHIFEKTKTHRQSELVRLLMQNVTGSAPRLQQVSNSCGVTLLVWGWAFPKTGTHFSIML